MACRAIFYIFTLLGPFLGENKKNGPTSHFIIFFSDGEQALIIASRSLGQENGPMVRRLVERSHANRNIEDNLKSLVPDQSHFAQFLSQWYKFCDSKSQIEAETSIKFMKEMFLNYNDNVAVCFTF